MDTNYPTPNSSPFESHQSPEVRSKTTTNGLAIKKRKKKPHTEMLPETKEKKYNERSRHKTNEITAPGWCGCWFVRRRNLRPGEFDCGKHRATGKRCSPHAQVHGTAGERLQCCGLGGCEEGAVASSQWGEKTQEMRCKTHLDFFATPVGAR